MSFLSSFLSRATPSAPPQMQPTNPQQARGDAGTMQFQSKPAGAGAPNPDPATMAGDGSNNRVAEQPAKPIDPLDVYSKMFDNPANKEVAPTFTMDDKVLGDVAKGQDFMRGVDPSLVERATSGDVKALMEMMNEVGRNAYKASLQHGGKLTEGFVTSREGYNEKGFSGKVRGELTVNALTGTPNFNNPVVRKQLTMIANNLQTQHPDASPVEIAQMSRDYITELSKAIAPASETTQQTNKSGPTDFGAWFDQNDGVVDR